ncbi:hypothetical protein [Saccharothrix sp. HUAS TT1]|uniref:phosphotransferase-like protein n=1 Tax=unclassified Saccharothrix TaxID=2593673 RepID=UPI00345BB09C
MRDPGRVILNGTSSAGKTTLAKAVQDLLPSWLIALSGLDVLLVRVTCLLAVAEQRERDRRNPNGLARGHYRSVHAHGATYDMTVDSTTGTPAELARAVLRAR